MRVGHIIKEIREKDKNYNQEYVAKKLDLSVRAYKNIESNITDITLDRLDAIATILEVSPLQIISNKAQIGGILNNFNNGQGNQGTNIMNQGTSLEMVQQLYERIIQEKDAIIEQFRNELKQ